MVGNLTTGPIRKPCGRLRGHSKTYKLSPPGSVALKHAHFNLVVFNLSIIIQRHVDFKLGLDPHFALKSINGISFDPLQPPKSGIFQAQNRERDERWKGKH